MRTIFGFLLVFSATSAPSLAQNSGNFLEVPQILVSGHGEVRIAPDRARIQISVQSRALTAAKAAAENASKQSAVIAAVRGQGVADEQISTANFSVQPEMRYEPNKTPVVTGYVVTNTVVVEVRKISSVGPILDAALGSGANVISGLNFFASNTESARRTAISSAVASARADAEAAAKAGGGSLGPLLELNIGSHSLPMPRPMMMARGSIEAASVRADTPISPGEETLSVEVSTRWRFIPGN